MTQPDTTAIALRVCRALADGPMTQSALYSRVSVRADVLVPLLSTMRALGMLRMLREPIRAGRAPMRTTWSLVQ
jgi:hypothetical protein